MHPALNDIAPAVLVLSTSAQNVEVKELATCLYKILQVLESLLENQDKRTPQER